MPDFITMAGNALQAGVRYAQSGFANITKEQYDQRLSICSQCEYFNNYQCTQCGCMLKLKCWMAAEFCPEGKWGPTIGSGMLSPHEALPPSSTPVPCLPCQKNREAIQGMNEHKPLT